MMMRQCPAVRRCDVKKLCYMIITASRKLLSSLKEGKKRELKTEIYIRAGASRYNVYSTFKDGDEGVGEKEKNTKSNAMSMRCDDSDAG